MSKKSIREQILLESLEANKKLTTQDVSGLLNISQSSARRMFLELEESGKAIRVYGGIQLPSQYGNLYNYIFDDIKNVNVREKIGIAKKGAELIENNDILYLDCGTTIFQLAKIIVQQLVDGKLYNIKIVTNSLANLEILYPHCDTILVGGNYDSNRKDFSGYSAEIYIKNFHYKKSFLGADGFDRELGFMATNESIARINGIAINRSEQTFILLDSSKICRKSFISYAKSEEVSALITDSHITEQQENVCDSLNLKILKSEPVSEL